MKSWAHCFVLIIGTGTSIVSWKIISNLEESRILSSMDTESKVVFSSMEKDLKFRINVLERMASQRARYFNVQTKSDWEENAVELSHSYPGFQAISWVDSDHIVRWVYPENGNEKLQNVNLALKNMQLNAITDSIANRKTLVTPLVKLNQGGSGFLTFVPIFQQQKFRGHILGVFRADRLFRSLEHSDVLDISVQQSGREVFSSNSGKKSVPFYQKRKLNFLNIYFSLKFTPKSRFLEKTNDHISLLVGMSVLLLTLLVSYITLLFIKRAEARDNISKLKADATKEIKKKKNELLKINSELERSLIEQEDHRKIAMSLLYDAREKEALAIASEEKVRSIVETAPDGIISIDHRGIILALNSSSLTMFQYTKDELLGKNVNCLMPGPYHLEHDSYLRDYLNTANKKKIGVSREVEGKRKDGSTFPAFISIGEFDEEGKKKFTGIIKDISPLKKVLQKLEGANQELKQFAYLASHDLQAPLRHISAYVDVLKEEIKPENLNEDASDAMEYIDAGTKKMKNLISDLLAFSKIGKDAISFSENEGEEIVNEVLEMLSADIRAISAVINIEKLPKVTCDRERIYQVFQNLISNALKYREAERKSIIEVSCKELSDKWCFMISDNGLGIPKGQEDRVFKIFQRAHQHQSYTGTGIGLAICAKIIKLHGGKIWVEGNKENGSTFLFTLPKIPTAWGEYDE